MHVVDDNNHLCHNTPCIERTWLADSWFIYIFSFFITFIKISTCFVLCQFAYKTHYTKLVLTLIKFLHWLIGSNQLKDNVSSVKKGTKTSTHNIHDHCFAHNHEKFYNDQVWVLGAKEEYQTYQCNAIDYMKCTESFCICNLIIGCSVSVLLSIKLIALWRTNLLNIICYQPFLVDLRFSFTVFLSLTC